MGIHETQAKMRAMFRAVSALFERDNNILHRIDVAYGMRAHQMGFYINMAPDGTCTVSITVKLESEAFQRESNYWENREEAIGGRTFDHADVHRAAPQDAPRAALLEHRPAARRKKRD